MAAAGRCLDRPSCRGWGHVGGLAGEEGPPRPPRAAAGQGSVGIWCHACPGSGSDATGAGTGGHHGSAAAPALWDGGVVCGGRSPPLAPARAGGARGVLVSPRPGTSPPASAPQGGRDAGPWGYHSSPQPRGRFRGAGCTPKYPKRTTPDPGAHSSEQLSVGRALAGHPGTPGSPNAVPLCAGRLTPGG